MNKAPKILTFIILAFSLNTWSAPPEPEKKDPRKNLIKIENQETPETPKDTEKTENGRDKIEKPQFFFSDTKAFSFYSGFAYYLLQTGSDFYGLFGLGYLWYSQTHFHLETAFDIYTRQEAHLKVLGKWYARTADSIRPYGSLGLGLKVLSSDNIGVFLAWNRVMLHVNIGFDISVSQSTSIKCELFAGLDQSINSLYGISVGPVFSY